jgi:hypothetical protein
VGIADVDAVEEEKTVAEIEAAEVGVGTTD